MKQKLLFFIIVILFLPAVALANEITLDFKPVQGQPYFASNQIDADSAELNTLIVTLSAKENGTARLFWANNYDPQFNQAKSLWFMLKSGEHTYCFNIASQNPYWIGWTKGFVIMPEMAPGLISVQQAKIVPSNLLTDIQSGWQEFWGPRGRIIVGSTINTIQSPNLYGQSIFTHVYWLIGLWVVAYFAWQAWLLFKAKKRPSIYTIFENTGKFAFILIAFLWIMLEISSVYNNYLQLKDDSKYIGKTMDEKLAIANYGDFYQFIVFCNKNLPSTAKYDYIVGGIYNDIKIRYYLSPREVQKEADFIIIYDAELPLEKQTQYSMVAQFRDKALIYQKRQK